MVRKHEIYELLKDNPEWGTAERRHEMNHFMARLIFCFFAEDTDIFSGKDLFIGTVEQMSDRDSSNTHEILGEIFRAMNTKYSDRAGVNIPRWADIFPYVNGGLFSGDVAAPRFSKIARSYLLHIGSLDWTKINPDIFGSIIQAVADDEERGELGMHYTSVPNILKVGSIVSNKNFALLNAPLWNMALIASRLHLVWIANVCGKLKTDFRYSNTMGWNTFPVPTLTEKNKADLTRCAEDILLAREAHFPATIADLYDPDAMPADLRQAHERNDEVLERIYIGRRFRNDTERLEKLFELYTKMTANEGKAPKSRKKASA